jgi:hypothetical protein
MKYIEWLGVAFGIVGNILLALNIAISPLGFVCYLISNCFLLYFTLKKKTWGLYTMYWFYMVINGYAVYAWFK